MAGLGFGRTRFALADSRNFVLRCFVFVISQISLRLGREFDDLAFPKKFYQGFFEESHDFQVAS
jgi:hypothetical protein